MKKLESISNFLAERVVYVNFSPYTNSGHILDFLLSEYKTVVCFTFRFHSLGKLQEKPNVSVYVSGKEVYYQKIFQPPVPQSLAFLLLPIRSLFFFSQILYQLKKLQSEYGPYDTFFTVNAFTAWTGNVLRSIGLVNRTIYWVWDYYPPIHHNPIIELMRKLYSYFDHNAIKNADKIVFLNPRIQAIHEQNNMLPNAKKYSCVGIGTNPKFTTNSKNEQVRSLVFFGVIKKSEGLDLVFDALEKIHLKNITLHIIGGGPDEMYFKKRAENIKARIIFHGYIPNIETVDSLLSSSVGLATYTKTAENVTSYTDPSKIKKYLSVGIPILTTDIITIAEEIQKYKAGIIVSSSNDLIPAITKIFSRYSIYSDGAKKLAKRYFYKTLYKKIFI